jgi:hypothetical protein
MGVAAGEDWARPAATPLPFLTPEHPDAPARRAAIPIAVAAALKVLLIVPPVAPILLPRILTVW